MPHSPLFKIRPGTHILVDISPQKTPSALTLNNKMFLRVKASANDPNIFVDLHAPGVDITLVAGKVLKVTVQILTFKLDCTRSAKLIKDSAMRF